MSKREDIKKIFPNILGYSEDQENGLVTFKTSPTVEKKNRRVSAKKIIQLANLLGTEDIEIVAGSTRARDLMFQEIEVRGVRF